MEAPSAVLACRLQQMVRVVPWKPEAPLVEELKSWRTSVKWLADVRSEVISRHFLRKCWQLCVFAFIVACQIYSTAQAWVHTVFISTTVQSLKWSTAGWLSPSCFSRFAFDKNWFYFNSSWMTPSTKQELEAHGGREVAGLFALLPHFAVEWVDSNLNLSLRWMRKVVLMTCVLTSQS